jgi:copper chaperone NosL
VTRRTLLGALAAATLPAACRAAARAYEPVAIAFGRDECAYCRMTIDDPRLAAEFIEAGGRVRMFGEPGCLVNWSRSERPPSGGAFVTDAAGSGWVPATAAIYVVGRTRTPMSYNLAAYRSQPTDAAVGAVRDWRTLLAEGITVAPR